MKKTITISDLTPKQYELFDKIVNTPASITKYTCIRSARQSGKTTLLIRLGIYFAFFKNNQHGAFISASTRQFLASFKLFLEVIPDSLIKNTIGGNVINFTNGSSLQFYTALNYNSIVGQSFDFLISDETALYPMGSLDIITPTLSAKKEAKAIFASTPRQKNDFYNLCMQGNRLDNPFVREYRMSYLDNPYYDLREIEEKRKSMSPFVFSQEYESEWVFGKGAVFGDFSSIKQNKFAKYDPKDRYFAGTDYAGDGEDSTVITIVNQYGEIALIYEAESNNSVDQVKELAPILDKYKPILWSEVNGLGKPITDMLLDLENQKETFKVNKFITTNDSKNELVTSFLRDIHKENTTIRIPDENICPKLDHEMSMFSVSRTQNGSLRYSHPDGFHDDHVMSMLLAYGCLRDNTEVHQYDMLSYADAMQDVDARIAQTFKLASDFKEDATLSKDDWNLIENVW
jgi:hypothetical protein